MLRKFSLASSGSLSVLVLLPAWLVPAVSHAQFEISPIYQKRVCQLGLEDHSEAEKVLARLAGKSKWRLADKGAILERRVKMKTNIQRRAGQMGGRDESADPAPPFWLGANDPRPSGFPSGVYWSNSGKYFYRSDTIDAGLHGGPQASKRMEFVFQYQTDDGRIVEQTGGYAAADSSWGWDGRFELQPLPDGSYELVVTQGAMELPNRMTGGPADPGTLPEISKHNFSRARRAFKVTKFENGKLYVLDQGPILGNVPNASGDWIAYETKKVGEKEAHLLKSAHGYGENFFPLPSDARKLRTDEFGYPIRVFDMVVREVHVQMPDGYIRKIPATTRGIAYRMDPKNPSKRVGAGILLPNGEPADAGIIIRSEELPGKPGSVAPSSVRSESTHGGKIIEIRTVNMDGTVTIEKDVSGEFPITLVEGFNPVPGGAVEFPSGKKYYLGTDSASEYTAGAPMNGFKEKRYGTYLGYRTEQEGWLGQYKTVSAPSKNGDDFVDMLEDFTESYHLSWGAGRPQAYRDDSGHWWLDVHFVDADLLKEGLPHAMYPASGKDFADGYRRHKAALPIRWVEKNGLPAFEIDDPEVAAHIEAYRKDKRR